MEKDQKTVLGLNALSTQKMTQRELNHVRGGEEVTCSCTCTCGCKYEGQPGGSSKAANSAANEVQRKSSAKANSMPLGPEFIVDEPIPL